MIALDIESSGWSRKCGIWQIGALELENTKNQFLEECRIDPGDAIEQDALKIIGKSEDYLRDSRKQSQKQLILNFLNWARECESSKEILGNNPGFDMGHIQDKCLEYEIKSHRDEILGHLSFDLHTIAQIRYEQLHNKPLLAQNGKSEMTLKNILKFCGLPDNRIYLNKDQITGITTHNALDDAKLVAECYNRMRYGKELFDEYAKFKLPSELQVRDR